MVAKLAFAQAEEWYFLDSAQLCSRSARRSLFDLPSSLTSWVPPPRNVLKLSFDGAWKLEAGLGFTLRNWNGEFILAGASGFRASSPLVAEVLAGCWAIDCCLCLPWDGNKIVEGDTAIAVTWLGGEVGSMMPQLMRTRQKNRVRGGSPFLLLPGAAADILARFGRRTQGRRRLWSFMDPFPASLF